MKGALFVGMLITAGAAAAQEGAPEPTPDVLLVDPCWRERAAGMPEGPIALGFGEADIGVGRRICTRNEVVLGGRAAAVIDTADFYGAIGATALIGGSYAINPRLELFGTLDLVRYQWVTNAVIVGSEVTLGQLTLGASQQTFNRGTSRGMVTGRVLLPTSFAAGGVRVVGAELGHAFAYHPHRRIDLHGFLAVDFSTGISAAAPLPRLGGVATVGAHYYPWQNVGFVFDVAARYGWTTSLAPAVAVRFGTRGGFGGEFALTRPVLGTDRSTAILGLRLGYRL